MGGVVENLHGREIESSTNKFKSKGPQCCMIFSSRKLILNVGDLKKELYFLDLFSI